MWQIQRRRLVTHGEADSFGSSTRSTARTALVGYTVEVLVGNLLTRVGGFHGEAKLGDAESGTVGNSSLPKPGMSQRKLQA